MVEGWEYKLLDEICYQIKSGGTPKADNKDYYGGKVPFVTIDDITSSNKYLYRTNKSLTETGLKNSNAWLVPDNTLLYSIYATLGVPIISKIGVSTSQAILAFLFKNNIDIEFVYYQLLRLRPFIIKYSGQTTQSNLSASIVREIGIEIPKRHSEQSKIAEILSTIDEAIQRTEQLIAKYQRIKTGLMQDLLTKGIDENGQVRSAETHDFKDSEIGQVPADWNLKPLKYGIDFISDYRGKTPPYTDSGIPVISAENVGDGKIKSITKYVSEETYWSWLTREIPEPNDVIFTMEAPVGEVALFPKEKLHLLTRRVIAFHTRVDRLVNTYLYWQLLFLKSKHVWERFSHGSTVPRLLKPDVLNMKFPFPEVKEQEKICEILKEKSYIILSLNTEKSKLTSIKEGLMQDLLSGKVRVNHLIKEKEPA